MIFNVDPLSMYIGISYVLSYVPVIIPSSRYVSMEYGCVVMSAIRGEAEPT